MFEAPPRKNRLSNFHSNKRTHINFSVLFRLKLGLVCNRDPLVCSIQTQKRYQQIRKMRCEYLTSGGRRTELKCFGWRFKKSQLTVLLVSRLWVADIILCQCIRAMKAECKTIENFVFQLREVKLVKPDSEHKEPTFVGFLIQQCAKMRMLELCSNLSKISVTLSNMKNFKRTPTLCT